MTDYETVARQKLIVDDSHVEESICKVEKSTGRLIFALLLIGAVAMVWFFAVVLFG